MKDNEGRLIPGKLNLSFDKISRSETFNKSGEWLVENLRLSQQRAESIRQYLVKKGISAARVIAKGYGASIPVSDNSTEEGRQKNRCTEVKIL